MINRWENERSAPCKDILLYWLSKRDEYPFLSSIARLVFACKPASASNECDFTFAGYFDDPLRSSMGIEHFINLVFLKSYS